MHRKQILLLVAINITSVFLLAILWEFLGEDLIGGFLFPHHVEESVEERWEFVTVATTFAAIAMIAPAALSFRFAKARSAAEAELRHLAATDPLTGAPNRRTFLEQAVKEISRAKRYNHDVGFLICDLDHFKRINDTHGHLVGDDVLKAFYGIAKTDLRTTDLIGRFGGEEFGIMLPETGVTDAIQLAERLRERLSGLELASPEGTVKATVSVGVAVLEEMDADLDSLMARADRALYEAKDSGRNLVRATQ